MVLDVPGLQHAAGLGVVVGVNKHGLRGQNVLLLTSFLLHELLGYPRESLLP